LPTALAIAHETGPAALRYPRGAGVGANLAGEAVPLPVGRAETLRHGDDVCVLAVGSMVHPALAAARALAAAGIGCEVVDMRFVKPLDEDLLRSVWERHRQVVTVEENSIRGGFGSAVLEWAAAQGAGGPSVQLIGIPDAFQEHATRGELLTACGLDPAGLAARIRKCVAGHGRSQAQSAS